MVGSVATMDTVWNFGDVTNGLMAIPNLISVLLLSGVAASETKKYLGSPGALDLPAPPEN